MGQKINTLTLALLMTTGAIGSTLEKRVEALEAQNSVLAEEILAQESDGFTLEESGQSYAGLGDAASKVYYSKSALSIGGYGEMYWAKQSGEQAYADVYRFVPYIGYRFADWVILNTELEFEHGANSSNGGKVVVEFMYLDFLLKPYANIRVGHVLAPMGLINQKHEPTLFTTVQRPEVEKYLIPSTWHENGFLVYGKIGESGWNYTTGIINALNLNPATAQDADGKANTEWIRDGRLGSSAKASFEPAFTGRLDYTGINGLMVGLSGYYGNASNQKEDNIDDVTMTLFDIHAQYEYGGFVAKALYTQSQLDGAENFDPNAITKASGYYVNASYDISEVLSLSYKVPVFLQYESYNPIEETVNGLNEQEAIENVTVGFNFFPTSQVVLKADYQRKDDATKEDVEEIYSFGLGFIF